jgi:4'-phosphopantetheinyl transferase
MLGPDLVHVWQIGLDPSPALVRVLTGVLDDAERSRLAGYRSGQLRRRLLVARGAVRIILGGYLSIPPDRVRIETGRWGKPELADRRLRFNVSHSGRLALLAVTATREVGVDIEDGTTARPAVELAARYFPPDEHRLIGSVGPDDQPATFRWLWVRKEACVKAAGDRLAYGLRLPVSGDPASFPGPAQEAGVLVTDPTGRLPGPWLVRDLLAEPGYAAAVALAGPQPYRTVSRRWRLAGVRPRRPIRAR